MGPGCRRAMLGIVWGGAADVLPIAMRAACCLLSSGLAEHARQSRHAQLTRWPDKAEERQHQSCSVRLCCCTPFIQAGRKHAAFAHPRASSRSVPGGRAALPGGRPRRLPRPPSAALRGRMAENVLFRLGYITLTIAVDWQPTQCVAAGSEHTVPSLRGGDTAEGHTRESGGRPAASRPPTDPRPQATTPTPSPGCPPPRRVTQDATRVDAQTIFMRVGMPSGITPNTPPAGWVVPQLPTHVPKAPTRPPSRPASSSGQEQQEHGEQQAAEGPVWGPRPPAHPPADFLARQAQAEEEDEEEDEQPLPKRKRKFK